MRNQQGVILLIALIIMSILLSTAVAFGIIIMSSLRQAKATDDAVVAYYAADAGLERSLFHLRKNDVINFVGSDETEVNSLKEYYSDYDGLEVELGTNQASWNILNSSDTRSAIYRQRLFNGQSLKVYLLKLDDYVGGENEPNNVWIDWNPIDNPAVRIQVTLTSLTYPFDIEYSQVFFTPGEEYIELPDLGNDYVLEIKVLGNSEDDFLDELEVMVQNDATDFLQGENAKLYVTTLHSEGNYRGSRQVIQAEIPPFDPVSGVLGFVLFSDQDIIKQ